MAAARLLHYAVHLRHLFAEDYDFANLPLLILVAALLSLLVLPAMNAWLRHHERQADRYVFRSLPSVLPFISAMNRLAGQNLAERSPPAWSSGSFTPTPRFRSASPLPKPGTNSKRERTDRRFLGQATCFEPEPGVLR